MTEMTDGYFDGRDPNSPEPSAERPDKYRLGFQTGRDDMRKMRLRGLPGVPGTVGVSCPGAVGVTGPTTSVGYQLQDSEIVGSTPLPKVRGQSMTESTTEQVQRIITKIETIRAKWNGNPEYALDLDVELLALRMLLLHLALTKPGSSP